MPTMRLTDRTIAGLTTPTRREFFDLALPGFGVRVTPDGRKSFVLLYRTNRKLRRLTIGTYPTITLSKARELAEAALRKATIGRDPAAERQQMREHTVGALAALYLEQHAKRKKRSWRDDARMIRQELKTWASRPVASLRRADVRELLERLVERGAPTLANRVLALVRKMLNFALDQEWVEANVAAKMPRPAVEHSRTRVLAPDELGTVWAWLERWPPDEADDRARTHWRLNRAALKLRLITAQRGGEVISMRWADLDLKGGWWTIPASVTKNALPHRVPLTSMARAILSELRSQAPETAEHVFAGIRGTTHRHRVLDGLKVTDLRPHDFRRTAASMMAAGGVSRLTISKILNHVETGVTAVYDRHSYDPEKRAALEWWAAKLQAILENNDGSKVLPFAKGT
jgi:integrase